MERVRRLVSYFCKQIRGAHGASLANPSDCLCALLSDMVRTQELKLTSCCQASA